MMSTESPLKIELAVFQCLQCKAVVCDTAKLVLSDAFSLPSADDPASEQTFWAFRETSSVIVDESNPVLVRAEGLDQFW